MKILSLPVDDGGCGWYRVRQPFAIINELYDGEHVAEIINDEMEGLDVLRMIATADIIFCRPGVPIKETRHTMITLMNSFNENTDAKNRLEMKAKWVMDIDDNVEEISPYSIHYQEYGTKEFYDSHAEAWLWKDGERRFDLQANKVRLKKQQGSMRDADLVITTTEKLAAYARQYNRFTTVIPNAINFRWWWKLNLQPNQQLRIGWAGGMSHYEDWYSIREPLNRLMKRFQFKLILLGSSFTGLIDKENLHLVETYDWIPFKGHSYRMMSMALDGAIIPLVDLPFNHFKSPIKYLEMSAMGVPSVVSNVSPYREVVNDERAFTYETPEEFYSALKELITSLERRSSVSKSALDFVHDQFDVRKVAEKYIEAFDSLLRR